VLEEGFIDTAYNLYRKDRQKIKRVMQDQETRPKTKQLKIVTFLNQFQFPTELQDESYGKSEQQSRRQSQSTGMQSVF